MSTIPTSYTLRALNRWLASLKLESDSPTIRALHAAVDELDDAPNDLIADAEALLLAATSITVLAFDALEHAAGEIGLEVDEEERAEVKESATLMRGIADLLGEIRERRAEDAMVEEIDVDPLFGAPSFWVSYDASGKLTPEEAIGSRALVQATSAVDATRRLAVSDNHGRTMVFFVFSCMGHAAGTLSTLSRIVVTDGVVESETPLGHVVESRWGAIFVPSVSTFRDFWVLSPHDFEVRPDALTLPLFMKYRRIVSASCARDAAMLHGINTLEINKQVPGPITMWVQPRGAHGELVDIAEFVLDWPSMMDGADRPVTGGNVLFTVEIFEVPDPGMEPAPQDVQDLLSDAPPVPVEDVYDTSSVSVDPSSTPTTQA